MTNAVLDAIHSRFSCRAFSDVPVTEEQLKTLTDAALASPSAMNRQPWHIVAVNNPALVREMDAALVEAYRQSGETAIIERIASRGNTVLYGAPCVIYVALKEGGNILDIGIATQNMALAAASLGLNSCIIAMSRILFQGETAAEWNKRLQIPDGYEYGITIAIGTAKAEGKPHELDTSKVTVL